MMEDVAILVSEREDEKSELDPNVTICHKHGKRIKVTFYKLDHSICPLCAEIERSKVLLVAVQKIRDFTTKRVELCENIV